MRRHYDILLKPIITEKSNVQKDEAQQVTFRVPLGATKIDIKRAVEAIFNKKVVDVKTIKVRGKMKRLGRFRGKLPDWKKAVVRLAQGEHIDFFEGV
jgi:large subunit ribosomal protein L23